MSFRYGLDILARIAHYGKSGAEKLLLDEIGGGVVDDLGYKHLLDLTVLGVAAGLLLVKRRFSSTGMRVTDVTEDSTCCSM